MSAKKLQRWIDLLAALLGRTYPATFREIAKGVPGYSATPPTASTMRMFERDKDELRSFGIAIETKTIEGDDGPVEAYRLDRKDFYLPYLMLSSPTARKPRRIDAYGYRTLATLAFDPDELAAIAEAAKRVETLGDPLLASDSASAQRKLALDLPVADMAAAAGGVGIVPPRTAIAPANFEAVNDALTRRKTLAFDYHAMSTDRTEHRNVEPYGVFFLGSHWYLTGRDMGRGELRNFRLSRIAKPSVNNARPQTPDYAIPDDFRLREHAGSRQAWEIGDGDALDAVVEFRGSDGATVAGSRLGLPVPGSPSRRAFQPRRLDTFARWLLAFGGGAIPLSPPELVDAFRDLAGRTQAVYGLHSPSDRAEAV